MAMRMMCRVVMLLLLVCLCTGCMDLNDLSNRNDVLRFEITSMSTPDVVLGDVEILPDSNVVRIPLLYGEGYLPITFSADVLIPNGACILNIDFTSFSFSETELERVFYVCAADGSTRRWRVRLVLPADVGLNQLTEFCVDAYVPSTAYVLRCGQITFADTTVRIVVPECTFPLTLQVHVLVSDGNEIQNLDAGSSLHFDNYESEHRFRVLTDEGALLEWHVRLLKPDFIVSNSEVGWSVWQAVSLDNHKWMFQTNSAVQSRVDDEGNCIWLLPADQRTNGADVLRGNVLLQLPSYVHSIGLESGDVVELRQNGAQRVCFLYDSVRQTCKRWQLGWATSAYYYGGFTKFQVVQNSPSLVEFLNDSLQIDALSATVWLPYRSSMAAVDELMAKVQFQLLPGCVVSSLYSGEQLRFWSMAQAIPFELTSGCGVKRRWCVRLLDVTHRQSLVGVAGVELLHYEGATCHLVLNGEVEVDCINRKIWFLVDDWAQDFPLQVTARVGLWPGVTVTPGGWNGSDVLTFSTLSDRYTLLLQSADRSQEATYEVGLKNRAKVRSAEAELLQFEVENLSGGYVVDQVQLNAADRSVVLVLSDAGHNPLTFVPRFSVSQGAYVEGLKNGQLLLFGSLSGQRVFTVISENEEVRQSWSIRVDASLQLPNSDFDDWSSKYVVASWATANSSFANTTERAEHGSGYCAKLTTTSVLGNVASGSLFLGSFKMDLSHLNDTKQMAYLGIPFIGRPKSMSVDVKYQVDGNTDKGSIEIDLLNYVGSDFEYHNLGSEPGVTMVAHGKLLVEGTNGWQRVTIPLTDVHAEVAVTHLSVVFASSYRGDELQGTVGATLWVDNLHLNY